MVIAARWHIELLTGMLIMTDTPGEPTSAEHGIRHSSDGMSVIELAPIRYGVQARERGGRRRRADFFGQRGRSDLRPRLEKTPGVSRHHVS